MLGSTIISLVGVCSVVATHLYVSSYIGTITTLEYSQRKGTLETIFVDNGAPKNTSFLLLNKPKDVLYVVEEGFDLPNGYVSTYKTSHSGKLTQLDRHSTIGGPVHQVVYNNGKALAVAH